MKRENPFISIYKQCNALSNDEKYKLLSNDGEMVPVYLDIELTNCCNIHCNMCFVGTGVMKRKQGFMTEDVFEKVLENIKKYHIKGVRFIRWGEPTLHPKFIEWVSILKKEGILVHFNTNGLLFNCEMIEKLLATEVDSIKFSFQGVNDLTYRDMRSGGSYSHLLDTIKMMYTMRERRKNPYISITTSITYEQQEDVMRFKEEVSPWCDEVGVGKTVMKFADVERMNLSKERSQLYKKYIEESQFNR